MYLFPSSAKRPKHQADGPGVKDFSPVEFSRAPNEQTVQERFKQLRDDFFQPFSHNFRRRGGQNGGKLFCRFAVRQPFGEALHCLVDHARVPRRAGRRTCVCGPAEQPLRKEFQTGGGQTERHLVFNAVSLSAGFFRGIAEHTNQHGEHGQSAADSAVDCHLRPGSPGLYRQLPEFSKSFRRLFQVFRSRIRQILRKLRQSIRRMFLKLLRGVGIAAP